MRSTISLFALSLSLVCVLATGCTNLDPCTRGTVACACRESVTGSTPACDDQMICAKGTCVAQGAPDSATVCYDGCAYRNDGVCDDGGDGSQHMDCGLGSDCSDCGARANPCTDPAKPVFCPQTPSSCWPATVDCLTVRYCPPEPTPFGCGVGSAVDCRLTGADRCVAFSMCVDRGLTPCIAESACVAPLIDCNSLAMCNGQTVGCFSHESVVCMAGQAPSCQPNP